MRPASGGCSSCGACHATGVGGYVVAIAQDLPCVAIEVGQGEGHPLRSQIHRSQHLARLHPMAHGEHRIVVDRQRHTVGAHARGGARGRDHALHAAEQRLRIAPLGLMRR